MPMTYLANAGSKGGTKRLLWGELNAVKADGPLTGDMKLAGPAWSTPVAFPLALTGVADTCLAGDSGPPAKSPAEIHNKGERLETGFF